MKKYLSIKNINFTSIVLNAGSIIFGIIYIITPFYNIFWDACGIIFIATLIFSFFNIYFTSKLLNKSSYLGNRINLMCYLYPFILSVAMICMMFGNFLISVSYSNALVDIFILYLIVFGGYFGTLIFGLYISVLVVTNILNDEIWGQKLRNSSFNSKTKVKKIIKIKIISIKTNYYMIIPNYTKHFFKKLFFRFKKYNFSILRKIRMFFPNFHIIFP